MIDLHCHILPEVDDGASSPEESLQMARLAVENGVTDIVATPHCNVPESFENYASPALTERFDRLSDLLREQEIPLTLHTGMEVYVTPEVPQLLQEGKLLTLNQSRYLLVEFAFDAPQEYADYMLQAIRDEGVIPVVAHPERYYFTFTQRECLLQWMEAGYVLQLNKGSLFGLFGRRAADVSHWCLAEGCVHLFGSDAHSPYRRTPRLAEAWNYTADFCSPEIAEFLLQTNPARILRDEPVKPVLAEF